MIIFFFGAAVVVGGADVAGGAAYAATQPSEGEDGAPLTAEDVVNGADVTSEHQAEPVVEQTTEKVVVVEKPVEKPSIEEPEKSSVTWDETTNYYVGDDKGASV